MPLFITFEGGEGCGKTFQARTLYNKLRRRNISAFLTREPGGTPLGIKISRWLKWTDDLDISPLAELLLFNASRAQLVARVIQPRLQDNRVVICDRYADSTTVYQGYGRGLEPATVEYINQTATGGLKPDVTILLDMPVEDSLARKSHKRADRFEQEDIDFHRRVRQGYLKLAAEEPQRWFVVDARQSKSKVSQAVWQRVSQMLPVEVSG